MVVFGESLSTLCLKSHHIFPIFLEKCINYLLKPENQIEGIFRINASERDLTRFQRIIDATGDIPIEEITSPFVVANLIMRFISKIPDHLLIDSNASKWDKILTDNDKSLAYRTARHLVKKLPPINKAIFSRLFALFKILSLNELNTKMGYLQYSILLSPILVEKPTDPRWILKREKIIIFFEFFSKIF